MKYEVLLEEAVSDDIYIIENANFNSKADGLINGNVIGINRKIRSYRKRNCVLAEEMGHYHTTTGDILNQIGSSDKKQELKARLWAYDRIIGLGGIIDAYENGCQDLYETAEYLEITEEFLLEALEQYKGKYGTSVKVGRYKISFVPNLEVTKK